MDCVVEVDGFVVEVVVFDDVFYEGGVFVGVVEVGREWDLLI